MCDARRRVPSTTSNTLYSMASEEACEIEVEVVQSVVCASGEERKTEESSAGSGVPHEAAKRSHSEAFPTSDGAGMGAVPVQNAYEQAASQKREYTIRQAPRFEWTPDVHMRFEIAVGQLGLLEAKPEAIRILMGCNGDNDLPTRQNIKSHLQKYRIKQQQHQQPHGQSSASLQSQQPLQPPAPPGDDPATLSAPASSTMRAALLNQREAVLLEREALLAEREALLAHRELLLTKREATMALAERVWGHTCAPQQRSGPLGTDGKESTLDNSEILVLDDVD